MPTITKTPSTITSVAGGTLAWASPSSAAATDGTLTEATLPLAGGTGTTHFLRCTNFTGATIPDGATVSSVQFTVKRKRTGGFCADGEVYEYYSGPVGSNLAVGGDWPTTLGDQAYTMSEFLPSVLNNSAYGVEISADLATDSGMTDVVAAIDSVVMSVTYTNPVPPPPFPGSGGLNTGAAFWLMLCALPALLCAVLIADRIPAGMDLRNVVALRAAEPDRILFGEAERATPGAGTEQHAFLQGGRGLATGHRQSRDEQADRKQNNNPKRSRASSRHDDSSQRENGRGKLAATFPGWFGGGFACHSGAAFRGHLIGQFRLADLFAHRAAHHLGQFQAMRCAIGGHRGVNLVAGAGLEVAARWHGGGHGSFPSRDQPRRLSIHNCGLN